jgi:Flp pilus assembly protein TadG
MKRPAIKGEKIYRSRKGTSTVLFAAALTVLAACAALTIDIGAIVAEKSRLSAAVDAAALAGVQELMTGSGDVNIIVNNYLAKNVGTLENSEISIGSDNKSVQVSAVRNIQSYFSQILGHSFSQISATAAAKAETIQSLKGARPLAVIQQTFTYGQQYTLKEGAGDGTSGNYAAIALGGTGGSIYRDNLLGGYAGVITVNDLIQTETGNIAGITETCITHLINSCTHSPSCTYNSYNSNCTRIIPIPVVNTLEVNGRKYIKVLGFATFFLEGVTNHGGQADVTGRFITYSTEGETSSAINDYGTYGIRLYK